MTKTIDKYNHLLHKIRHALIGFNDDTVLSGVVEMDACYTGNYTRPENKEEDRKDRRLSMNQNPKKRAVSVVRQRASREDIENSLKGAVATKVFVTKGEYSDVINKIAKDHIKLGSKAMNTSNNCEWVGYWQGNRPACEKLTA